MLEVKSFAALRAVSDGVHVKFTCVIQDMQIVPGKYGKDILKVSVSDGETPFFFNIYDDHTDIFQEEIALNNIVSIEGITKLTPAGTWLARVTDWSVVAETEELIKHYKPRTLCRITEKNKNDFISGINIIQVEPMRRLVEVAYGVGRVPAGVSESTYRERMTIAEKAWASLNRHDCYEGGYINHITDMLRLARKLQELYGQPELMGRVEKSCDINWDYLFTAIYLHDIGKADTYSVTSSGTVRYKSGNLMQHGDMGMAKVWALNEEIEHNLRLDSETLQHLMYIVKMHCEPVANRKGSLIEDELLCYIDGIDAGIVNKLKL